MDATHDGAPGPDRASGPAPAARARLTGLRGPVPPADHDARTIAALAANPGCRRRALLDAAGVDKAAVAHHLGRPAPFGRSPFAISRGIAFERRLTADDCAELLATVTERLDGSPAPAHQRDVHALGAGSAEERLERTRLALEKVAGAGASGGWTLLEHPMLTLSVGGTPARLEPDAVLVGPDGGWTVVEVKSFPVLDGSADPVKVGAAARQAAVYALALQEAAEELGLPADPVRPRVVLVCPEGFGSRPTASVVDLRRQIAVTRRQLRRMASLEETAAALPPEVTFDLRPNRAGRPTRDPEDLERSLAAVAADYTPDCLAACELSFHCRHEARACGAPGALGRGARGELSGLGGLDDLLRIADEAVTGRADAGRAEEEQTVAGPGAAPSHAERPNAGPADAERPDAERPDAERAGAIAGATAPAAAPPDAWAIDRVRRAARLRSAALFLPAPPHAGPGAADRGGR
ncbi:hypothetical protein [Allostreptomyces psammosilenae]|uniref:Secreted protein n=1 Tax=Allostreptomyces psammosilenae TaxID=1892865 RepID=A0A853A1M9_9ACTN|nr:hypothetical protein [Allostreptomyces psammosilenae]NYI08279.1 hypothetical protein [Allostreptomyces psammosilenae]